MTESERKGRLKDLFQFLENDMTSLYPRFPDQAIYALGDTRVMQALGKRFEQDVGLDNITRLPYSMETGLNALSFEFTQGASGLSTTDAFLVIMDGNCRVAGVIDPFDPAQPNGFMPPLPREGAQPFVLSRPSPQVSFSDDELLAARARRRAYFKRLASGAADTGLTDDLEIYTTCNYMTQTPGDYWPDNNRPDDCGMPPILT